MATNNSYTAVYNTPYSPPAGQILLFNAASCSQTPQLEVVWVGSPTPPGSGTITSWTPTGSFVFTPTPGVSGKVSFVYIITDKSIGVNSTGIVYLTVPPAGQSCVVAADDSYTGVYDTPYSPPAGQLLLVNDASCSQTPQLQVVGVGSPTPGSGTITSWTPTGSFVFTPTSGWSGTAAFPYTITDKSNGLNATANVYITIPSTTQSCVVAFDDYYTGVYNQPYSPPAGSLILVNDSSCSQSPQLVVVSSGSVTAGTGVLTSWTPTGSFVFTPTTNWFGSARYPYTITDKSNGLNATAYVHITIPSPSGQTFTLSPANYTYTGTYSKPFSPVDASSFLLSRIQTTNPAARLSVVRVTQPPPPEDGVVTVDPNGDFTFTPAPAWQGAVITTTT